MNKLEHLLLLLQEECAEVIHASSKAIRFGLEDGNPATPWKSNRVDLARELAHVRAAVEMIEEYGEPLTGHDARATIDSKKIAVQGYLNFRESNRKAPTL